MDIKDRVMGDQPGDFLHQIASIVPGYHGYVDRERRRDADKILRMGLAHRFTTQRERLGRVQQGLLRGGHLEEITEIDRLSGALQRFIDRLSVATYGYSGLFDPIRIEAADLDQLYTFDMALASGVEQVSSAIDALEAASGTGEAGAAGMPELPAAITRLSGVLDELNGRLNARADLLASGRRLPDSDYRAILSSLTPPSGAQPAPPPTGGEMGRYTPEGTGANMEGTPTRSLGAGATQPGASSGGIETASSPVDKPGAPGGDIVHGLEMTPPEDNKPSV